ncbi:MAG: hypothetical protein MI976_31895 [Pseudomonadales bacterium]|nr:hypothetical protein [Pseudomonadales bacterium]
MKIAATLKRAASASALFLTSLSTALANPFGDTAVMTQGYSHVAALNHFARFHRPDDSSGGSRATVNGHLPGYGRTASADSQPIKYPQPPRPVQADGSRPCNNSAEPTAELINHK